MAQNNKETLPLRVQGPPPGVTAPSDDVRNPQVYETFPNSNSQSHTVKPTGQKNPPQPTIKDGIQSIKPDDFFNVHKIPCARQGLMTGIGAGAAVGMGRYFVGGTIPKSTNWAFGAFFIGSIIQWEYCRTQRANERMAVARIVEVMDKKQAEKKAQAEAARLKQEAEKAKQDAVTAVTKKSWYKFW
ncbi:uncharacterized protein F4812DRAFT_324873 [Daldinia caldariorum]|uniref:uncharacterized protein n=1 Tax=Daldinia caldariorum TaxID=326644 RepID=UPI002008D266|nr:uncharacterized protein F4812DRAFT_324873 [Daldinia caldariorum]KAI1469299.1 hypothetical protein F4812DRAFT_324873 [Daldinia caldariorum]